MKRIIFTLLFVITTLNCFSQIKFESGYFIDNNGLKINCLIKNIGWRNNPTSIDYKLSKNSELKTLNINSAKEFSVSNLKYLRSIVDIDRSGKRIHEYGYSRNPEFTNDTIFLKILIEGEASLYQYVENNLEIYFYNTPTKNITQLIYKKYKITETKVGTYELYKQDLLNELKCNGNDQNQVSNLIYSKQTLEKYFANYNECKDFNYVYYSGKKRKELLNLYLRPGINITSLSIPNETLINPSLDFVDFGTNVSFRIGVLAEFIMPFKNNKWSVIFEPTYNKFETESTTNESFSQNVKIEYKSFELPIGLRHYFFLNNNSTIFINGSFVFLFDLDSIVDFEIHSDLTLSNDFYISLGLGYSIMKKFSLEVKYDLNRGDIFPLSNHTSSYSNLAIIFGYQFF